MSDPLHSAAVKGWLEIGKLVQAAHDADDHHRDGAAVRGWLFRCECGKLVDLVMQRIPPGVVPGA